MHDFCTFVELLFNCVFWMLGEGLVVIHEVKGLH